MRGNLEEMIAEIRASLPGWSERGGSQLRSARSPGLDPAEDGRAKVRRRIEATLPAIPENWRELTHPQILQAIKAWRWGNGNLILLGHTGCGKTLGAAVLARRILREAPCPRAWARAKRIVFVDAAQLALAREQHGLGQGEAPLVERCTSASLLFLDELGYLDKDTGVVEQVIDARSKANRPVVVTSGMTPEELVDRYGAAIGRKLMEGRRSHHTIATHG